MGSQGGVSLLEVSPDSIVLSNWHAKLGAFFSPLFLTITLEQMTIKHSLYMQKYTSTIQKGPMWLFSVLGFYVEQVFRVLRYTDSSIECIIWIVATCDQLMRANLEMAGRRGRAPPPRRTPLQEFAP